jgi:hypothetical protein
LNAPNPIPQETAAPGSDARLFIWFGIYLAAQVPMIWRLGFNYSPVTPIFFPFSLGFIMAIPLNMLPDALSQLIAPVALPIGFVAACVVYPAHLVATLRAKTRRRFSFLLLELVTLVLMNQSMAWSAMTGISM